METLQEFIRFTKGWEYIIAIVAIIVFTGFWSLLSAPGGKVQQEEDDDRSS
ncbi:sulfate respiration complex protein HmcD [Chloroflexota bacterium]